MRKTHLILLFALSLGVACGTKTNEAVESAPGAVAEEDIKKGVWFIQLQDGDELTSPITVKMGVGGMEIEPAGMVTEGKGHHHLIIDGSFIEKGTFVPADDTHIHYGGGQTEVELELTPGEHTLTMQFADGVHTSYGEEWSNTIKITVK